MSAKLNSTPSGVMDKSVVTPDRLADFHEHAKAAAAIFRLPFHFALRHGETGNWLGAGIGSSIDFHDHRPYLPGDDPRYIDWGAYARSGSYTMKLYREETRPTVDLVVDCSPSMFFQEQKAVRSLELLYFVLESSLRAHAALRIHLITGSYSQELSPESLLAYNLELPAHQLTPDTAPDTFALPLRSKSLRILLSDGLYPETPRAVLRNLGGPFAKPICLFPFLDQEQEPDWGGNMRFLPCEGGTPRKQHVDLSLLDRYQKIYLQHFALWNEECRRAQVPFAHLRANVTLTESLRSGGLLQGAVELCN